MNINFKPENKDRLQTLLMIIIFNAQIVKKHRFYQLIIINIYISLRQFFKIDFSFNFTITLMIKKILIALNYFLQCQFIGYRNKPSIYSENKLYFYAMKQI